MWRMFSILLLFSFPSQSSAQFYSEGVIVIDFENKIEWFRCTLGQSFNLDTEKCDGNTVKLNHDEIFIVIEQANEQLGGNWRLPTRAELKTLICEHCQPPKIDTRYFPGTQSEPYWTGEKNWISPKNYWSVNFMTGDTYGRFFPQQRLLVMILRDR